MNYFSVRTNLNLGMIRDVHRHDLIDVKKSGRIIKQLIPHSNAVESGVLSVLGLSRCECKCLKFYESHGFSLSPQSRCY